jgi:prepilin-type N-terminal cleavage/methylation domain-containing protein
MMGRSRSAFTLVELLVVISIIIILASVSIPSLVIIANSKRLENAGRTMQAALNEARRLSITKRKHHRVVFADSGLRVYDTEEKKYVGEKMSIDPRVTYFLGFSNTPPFNDSAEDAENPSPDAINNFSIEFRNDGSIIFDPHTSVSRSLYEEEGNDEADLIIRQTGEKRRCYVDIDPASGRSVFKVEIPKVGG